MEEGSIIRLNRIKKRITQEQLAKGIITVSYLSKIENNKVKASDHIIQLLKTKLGILDDSSIEIGWDFFVEKWCRALINNDEVEEIKNSYKKIIEIKNNCNDTILITRIDIFLIRYFCRISDSRLAFEQIKRIKPIVSSLGQEEKYYWYRFNANYYYLNSDFINGYSYYSLAESQMGKLELADYDVAEMYYSIGINYSKLFKASKAVIYIKMAIIYYKNEYNLKKCISCHIIQGICYRRLNNIEDAIKEYTKGIELAIKINDVENIDLINLNLGYLYLNKGDLQSALKYYNQVIHITDKNIENKLIAYLNLVKDYIKRNEKESALKNITEGLNLIQSSKGYYKNNINSIEIEFNTFLNYLNGKYEDFEKLIENDLIPMYQTTGRIEEVIEYSKLLSYYYELNHKYKKAYKYAKTINEAYDQLLLM